MTAGRAAPLPRRVLGGARPAGGGLAARLRPGLPARQPGPAGDRTGRRAALTRAVLDPARHLPRPRRPAHRGLRRAGAPGRLGVGQVAAARPAPVAHRRARPGAAGRQRRRRAGEAARRRARQPAPVQPGRSGRRRAARGGRARRRRPDRAPPSSTAASTGSPCSTSTSRRRGCSTGRCWCCEVHRAAAGVRSTRTRWTTRPRSARPTGSTADSRGGRPPAGAAAAGRRCPKSSDTPLAAELGLAELLGLGDPETFSVARAGLAAPAQPGPAAGADRRRRRRRRRSSSTSRSPPRTAWARTAC